MKTFLNTTFLFVFVVVLNSFAQTKMQNQSMFSTRPQVTFTKFQNDLPLASEGQRLLDKINAIKAEGDISKEPEIESLIRQFNGKSGLVEEQAASYSGNMPVFQKKALHKSASQPTLIYKGNMKSYASATEQTGSTKGRVWMAFTHGATPGAAPDTLTVFWSDDGEDYHFYASFSLGGKDIFWQNDIDMEIVEKSDGAKFLWIFYTYSDYVPFSVGKIGGMVIDLVHSGASVFALHWPGQSDQENYYSVHITSDNSVDANLTWLYIVCSMDSVGAGGNTFYGQKFAAVTQTSTTTGFSVLYRSKILPVFWQSGDANPFGRYLFTDIAYFQDAGGHPRLTFTYSNIPDSTKIWLSQSDNVGGAASFVGTLGETSQIGISRIASPGGPGNQQLMVVGTVNFNNSGDWDLVSWKTLDGGTNWNAQNIESRTSSIAFIPAWPDIYAKWNDGNNYRVAYILGSSAFGVPDSVMFVRSADANSNNWRTPVKVSDGIQFPSYTRVGFVGDSGADCYVLWSDLDLKKLYSASCALATGVEDHEVSLDRFRLYDNYPNPFNPSTTIVYKVQKTANVSIDIFNSMGQRVRTLVDAVKLTGTYSVRWDGRDDSGALLATGEYYYQLRADNRTSSKEMLFLK